MFAGFLQQGGWPLTSAAAADDELRQAAMDAWREFERSQQPTEPDLPAACGEATADVYNVTRSVPTEWYNDEVIQTWGFTAPTT